MCGNMGIVALFFYDLDAPITIPYVYFLGFMAEAGVGGLAYSGKIMEPQSFSPLIASIRDRVHASTGQYFDCCLINLYRDGECACAYHSDPDMVRHLCWLGMCMCMFINVSVS